MRVRTGGRSARGGDGLPSGRTPRFVPLSVFVASLSRRRAPGEVEEAWRLDAEAARQEGAGADARPDRRLDECASRCR